MCPFFAGYGIDEVTVIALINETAGMLFFLVLFQVMVSFGRERQPTHNGKFGIVTINHFHNITHLETNVFCLSSTIPSEFIQCDTVIIFSISSK